jgi:hypothetical protein
MKLWASSAMTPHGNPFGLAVVVADTRDEAVSQIRAAIEAAGPQRYVPAEEYRQSLLGSLDTTIEEVTSGVLIDWSAAEKR